MKTNAFSILFLFLVSTIFGQTVNLNPDPYGPPWIAGPQPELTPEILATLTEHHMSDAAMAVMLPASCDNSDLPINFFPPITQQEYNSCAQAAGVEYTFAYEINRYRGVAATSSDDNKYHQSFTYNFLNYGLDVGSHTHEGWNIIINNGIPSKSHYLSNPDTNDWHTGYDDYYQGTTNRIVNHAYIHVNSIAKLEELKTWVFNHDDTASNEGGLGVFDLTTDFEIESMQIGAGGEKGIIGTGIGNANIQHALTIVGYDDGVGYNFDSTGGIENIGPLADWELGAFKVANSWGENWAFGNNGFIWVPYRFLDGQYVRIITEVESREPEMVAKIKYYHDCRSVIEIGVFITDQHNAIPTQWSDYYHLEHFGKLKCGCVEVLGNGTTNPMEIAFDLTDYIDQYNGQATPQLKFILGLRERDDSNFYEGEILDFSIHDYRGDEPFEVYHHEGMPKPILPDDITNVTLHYFVLPEIISTDTTFTYPTIVRDQVLVQANATLNIGSFFDFYDDGHLEVQNGGLLNLNTNTSVLAMRGANNQITLIGDMQLGYNISFGRRNSFPSLPDFSLMLNNIAKNFSFGSFNFTGTIFGESNALALQDVTFIDANVDYKYGNFSLSGSGDINSTSLIISEPASASKTISISENVFTYSQSNQAIITIEDYSSYEIVNNTINHGYGDGIHINNAGDIEGDKKVSYNIISNNGSSSSTSAAGIVVYNSHTDIHYNTEITGNPYGIKSLNNSKTSIRGHKLAHSPSETQHIYNNDYNQVFSTPGAIPYYCHWNAIENSESNHPELFYYEDSPNTITLSDVRWNYWGPSFDPLTDLVPGCRYDPVWNNFYSITDTLLDADEQLYNTATLQINGGNYSGAQQSLKQLILNYPDSLLAEVAIKDLYVMEDQAGNNFDSLILYFENDSIIQSHLPLKRIARYLINFCELKQENFQEAIDGFTGVILNPETFEDSIFAIIDLAYAYQEMENSSGRDFYLGSLPQYYFHTKKLYRDSRQYHLSLINFNERQINEYADGRQLAHGQFIKQNYPNPSSQYSTFAFKLNEDAGVEIIIFDQLGRTSLSSGNRSYSKGDHQIKMNISSLPPGVYFYTLKVDGRVCDTGKMIKTSQ